MRIKHLPKFNITNFEVAYLFEFQKWIHVFCNKKIINIDQACLKCNKFFKYFHSMFYFLIKMIKIILITQILY